MLLSSIKEIDHLRMTKVTKRPAKAEAMVVVEGMVVVRLPGDRWWCSWKDFEKYARLPGTWDGRVQKLLDGLVLLGLVKKEVAEAHMKLARHATAMQSFDYDKKKLKEMAEQYGFPCPEIKPPVQEK